MSSISKILWKWPDGLIWKITNKPTLKSRQKRYKLFITMVQPKISDTILDVGVAPYAFRGINFLKQWYPYPEKIVALTNDKVERFKNLKQIYPQITLIIGDGKSLPFPDNCFDIVFCNAVVEHVGNFAEQRKLIAELVRVGKKCFITTPNYWFPIDAHTLIPFAHWLPIKLRFWVYRNLGRGYFADINRLNLLTGKQFIALFPQEVTVKLTRQRIFGLTTNLIVYSEKTSVTRKE